MLSQFVKHLATPLSSFGQLLYTFTSLHFMLPRFRSMRLLITPSHCFAWLYITLTQLPFTHKSTCSLPFNIRSTIIPLPSLHSFQYCTVYPLSIFVLAFAACLCFGIVMVLPKTHAKPLRKRSSIAPLHGSFILHSCRHSQPHLSCLRLWLFTARVN